MKPLLRTLLGCLALACLAPFAGAEKLTSPSGRIVVDVESGQKLYYSVELDGTALIKASPLSMTVGDGRVLAAREAVREVRRQSHDGSFTLPWGKRREVKDRYNEAEFVFDGYSVVFRAYDDGVAYRFRTALPGDLIVRDELVQWNLASDFAVWTTEYNTLSGSFEAIYERKAYGAIKDNDYAYAPVLLEHPQGPRVLITDADVLDYPGLYVQKEARTARTEFKGLFPAAAKRTVEGGHALFNRVVVERENYLAKTVGKRDFPWRALVIAASDRELLDSDLVTKLARPSTIADTSWIQPGHSVWEWWNDWNLTGVPFKTGINIETYRAYIDFAAENHIPYLVVDEGWSNQFDLSVLSPTLDIKAVIDYAKSKNVKVILWVVWKTLADEFDTAFKRAADLGAAGFKVDFFDRDDQAAVMSVESIATEAAKHHLVVDFHGCRGFAGMARTHPNILNFEGVRGGEYNKFSKDGAPYPAYNVVLPFTRGLVATMDYTPGGMRNVLPSEFVASNSNPVTVGTRCHQLAMFVVYDAPLQMLCDSPSAYNREPAFLKFLRDIPVTWDDSVALDAKVGEFVAIARRTGSTWYVGCMSGREGREAKLSLSFLAAGEYRVTQVGDSINSDRAPTDYVISETNAKSGDMVSVHLAPGGGAVLKIEKK